MTADPASPLPRLRRGLLYAVSVTILLGLAAAMLAGVRAFVSSSAWVEHSHQVSGTLTGLLAATREVESAARGYRLTGRHDVLADYLAAEPLARAQAAQLVRLTADNPAQQARARRLADTLEQRLAALHQLVELQQREGAEAARLATERGTGFARMREIDRQAGEMLLAERALLTQRQERSAQLAGLMTAAVVVGVTLPLALLSLLLRVVVQESRRSRQLEREARASESALRGLLTQRDRLSEQRRKLGAYAGLLQSCQTQEEAVAITAELIGDLLPDVGGRCYVCRASQNLAESSAEFGPQVTASTPLLHPEDCWALRRGQSHVCEAGRQVRCRHVEPSTAGAGWTLCVPLSAQGTPLGLLYVSGPAERPVEEDRAIVEAIAEQLGLAMVNLQLRDTLRQQSLRDPLTGLYNRRYLEESLARELLRCERRGLPLSVVMVDVDHFKRFNDSHGHAAGDALLTRVGQILQEQLRGEDIACRYGGEEFTLVLPEADREAAARRAEDIRIAISRVSVPHLHETVGAITVSLGVSTFPIHARTPQELLRLADAALYRAKAEGRDRVVTATG